MYRLAGACMYRLTGACMYRLAGACMYRLTGACMYRLTGAGSSLDLLVEAVEGVVVRHQEDMGRVSGDGRQLCFVHLVADSHHHYRHALLLQLVSLHTDTQLCGHFGSVQFRSVRHVIVLFISSMRALFSTAEFVHYCSALLGTL